MAGYTTARDEVARSDLARDLPLFADPDVRVDNPPEDVEGFHLGVQALSPTANRAEDQDQALAPGVPVEVMHRGRIVLIDPQWRIRANYDGNELNLEQVSRDVRQVASW